jgi:hypothetical protein
MTPVSENAGRNRPAAGDPEGDRGRRQSVNLVRQIAARVSAKAGYRPSLVGSNSTRTGESAFSEAVVQRSVLLLRHRRE